jgi:hypothetical protein
LYSNPTFSFFLSFFLSFSLPLSWSPQKEGMNLSLFQ